MTYRLSDFRLLMATGLNSSGEGHWQTRWEELHPAFERIEQLHSVGRVGTTYP
jgi:predicted alpha/beta hydrolase family esterase